MSYPYPTSGQPQSYNPYGNQPQQGNYNYGQPAQVSTGPYPHAAQPQAVQSSAFIPQPINNGPVNPQGGPGASRAATKFGALARGYPNQPWFCAACTAHNMNADRMYCEVCESRRPPMAHEVQLENFRMRSENNWTRSGWEKYDYSTYGMNQPPTTGQVAVATSPTSGEAPDASTTSTATTAKGVEMTTLTVTGSTEGTASTKGQTALEAAEMAGTHTDTVGVMGISQDIMQRTLATGLMIFNIYRTVMACLLSIFVPQRCEDDFGIVRDCTMKENFEELDTFNIVVVVFNFVTLAIALTHSFMVYRRESKLLVMLDEDPAVTNDFLVKDDEFGNRIIDLYPAVRDTVNRWNKTVMFTATLTLVLYLVNVVISGILIFGWWYAGYHSVTVFLTNMALNVNMIFTHWKHSRNGVKKGLALSMYKTDPSVYNNIDRKRRERYFVKRTQLADNNNVR